MPPRGVKKGTKRARQYEKIKKSQKDQGSPGSRRGDRRENVNKERARSGESRQRSRTSTQDKSSSQRGRPSASGHQRAQGTNPRPARTTRRRS